MYKSSITNRKEEFNDILTRWQAFYNDRTARLVYHLYEEYNYTYDQIAKILDIKRQRVHQMFPKEKL